MSLINKMLQDLDARGTPAADAFPSQIRPVARERAGLADRFDARSVALAVGGTAAACAVAAAAWFGWDHYRQSPAPAAPSATRVPAAASTSAAPAARPASGMSSSISMTQLPAGPQSAAPVAEAAPESAGAAAPAPAPAMSAAPAPAPAAPAASGLDDHFDAPLPQAASASAPAPKTVAGYAPDSAEARAARRAIMAELEARMAPVRARPAAPAHGPKRESKHESKHESTHEPKRESAHDARRRKPAAGATAPGASAKEGRPAQGRQESGTQRAEGEYRHALNALQDGRMTEAVAALEQALKLDPAHEAARQTLVGLLIEAKRGDEAARQLQAALALDARQPALAMLLARLQIEAGGSGIDTLVRTLPYAGNNADYHAFLAGALQRAQRNREAAEQYQAALRTAPGNGVWWMGLGMSLQAEKRNAEALQAFQRARASGTLSAELLAFVERRLQQLGR